MKQAILDRLKALGADISEVKGESMLEDLQAIKFNTFLYDEEYLDIVGADIISDFLSENSDDLSDDLDEVADLVLNHFWNYHKGTPADETYLGQIYYKGEVLDAFDTASDSYEEWNEWFVNEADLSEVQEVVGDVEEPTFINLFSSHGFPDNYYICLQDPNPENPTVFGTDHEAAFIEIESYGTLDDFLGMMLTKDEFRGQIREYLDELEDED